MAEERVTYSDGVLDEIVVENCIIHIEDMGDEFYWIGIYKGDKQVVTLNIFGRVEVVEEKLS